MNRYLSWAAILMLGTAGCAIVGPPRADDVEEGDRADGGGDDEAIGDPVSVDGAPVGDETTDESEAEEPGPGDVPDVDDPNPGTDPGDDPGEEPTPPQADFTTQVCYPGANGAGDTCLPVVPFTNGFPSAYDYPGSSQLAYQAPIRFIDLDAVSPSIKLAPNFALSELMQAHKGRYALFQPHTVAKLQSMREQTGGAILVHSAYRNPGYNAGVGGATYSRHMYGDAIDMHSAVVSLNAMKAQCQAHGADYVSVYATHVHCDWRYEGNNPSFYGTSPMQIGDPNAVATEDAHVARRDDGALTAHIDGFDEGEPYREWTSFDARGNHIETVAGESYTPPANTGAVEVMIGGRAAFRISGKATIEVTRLADDEVMLRLDTLSLDTLSAPSAIAHHHD